MKCSALKKTLAILILTLGILPIAAQQPSHQGGQQNGNTPGWQPFNPEEFTKRMEGYICMKAELTPEQAQKFFPVYREFKAKQRELTFKQQGLKRMTPADDKEYEKVVLRIAELSVQIAKLEQTYFPKFCKLITAKKVYKVLQAENDFHREMVRQPWGGGFKNGWGNNGNNQQNWGNPNPQRRGVPQQNPQQKKK